MMRAILTLCCLGLLGGVIAVAALGTSERYANSVGNGPGSLTRSGNRPANAPCLDCQHPLPLWADADETDDDEELSDREKLVAAHYATPSPAAGPSPRVARFEATLQHRLANTLNALGVRLQI